MDNIPGPSNVVMFAMFSMAHFLLAQMMLGDWDVGGFSLMLRFLFGLFAMLVVVLLLNLLIASKWSREQEHPTACHT